MINQQQKTLTHLVVRYFDMYIIVVVLVVVCLSKQFTLEAFTLGLFFLLDLIGKLLHFLRCKFVLLQIKKVTRQKKSKETVLG